MKALKIVVLNLIVFLSVSQSDKAVAFDSNMLDYATLQTLDKGEWSVGVNMIGTARYLFPIGGYIRVCPISHIEFLGLIQIFSAYYGVKMKCLEENNSFPSITLGLINGIAITGFEGEIYKIDSLYLTFSKNIKNFNIHCGMGKGSTPLVRNDYYLYGGIEKVIGRFKMFLGANRFDDDDKGYYKYGYSRAGKFDSGIGFIGCSYEINKLFVVKLTGGFWSEKFFELPKDKYYYLTPALTIEYNKRKRN